MHAFSLSSSLFTFKLPLIPEPVGQRLIAVNMSVLHMPTVCLHKILACHHAVCPTPQKKNLFFHNKVGFQDLEMKPEGDKGFTMWWKHLKYSKELRRKRCNYLLPTAWTLQLLYQSSHRWDESENKNNKNDGTIRGIRRGSFHYQGPFGIRAIVWRLHKIIKWWLKLPVFEEPDISWPARWCHALPVVKEQFGHFMTEINVCNSFKDKLCLAQRFFFKMTF